MSEQRINKASKTLTTLAHRRIQSSDFRFNANFNGVERENEKRIFARCGVMAPTGGQQYSNVPDFPLPTYPPSGYTTYEDRPPNKRYVLDHATSLLVRHFPLLRVHRSLPNLYTYRLARYIHTYTRVRVCMKRTTQQP